MTDWQTLPEVFAKQAKSNQLLNQVRQLSLPCNDSCCKGREAMELWSTQLKRRKEALLIGQLKSYSDACKIGSFSQLAGEELTLHSTQAMLGIGEG
jgi:hypothetical protein